MHYYTTFGNLDVVAAIMRGVKQLHSINVNCLHLNPNSIFIKYEPSDGVLDLKIASFFIDSERSKRNQQYDPPETIYGVVSCFDADMWALGVIMHVVSTYSFPFGGNEDEMLENRNSL